MKTRGASIVLLATACFFLSGCVYLHLLQLKYQLADFDNNFRVETKNGLHLICLKPLLVSDDLRWLGIAPEKVTKLDHSERWNVRWTKEKPAEVDEKTVYDVQLEAVLTRDRLTEVLIPDRFFAFFPKELLVKFARAAGQAKIDRSTRNAQITTQPESDQAKLSLPNVRSIENMLGAPTQRAMQAGAPVYHYRYELAAQSFKIKPIDIGFMFDPVSGDLAHITAKLPSGTMQFDLGTATPARPAKP